MENRATQVIEKLMPHWSLAGVEVCEFLPGGYSNLNYRVVYENEQFALRITPEKTRTAEQYSREAAYVAQLPEGLAAQTVAFDSTHGHMLSKWIEGTLLIDFWAGEDVEVLAAYLTELHHSLPPTTWTYDVNAVIESYSGTAPEPPFEPEGNVVCHNDLNPWNIIVTPDGHWTTLDWEMVGRNDPLFDLVTLHQGLGLPETTLMPLAELYLGVPPSPHAVLAVLKTFWLREWAWAKHQLAAGNTRQEIIDQVADAKMKLAAIPALRL